MKDSNSGSTNGKAIKVTPDELIFDSVNVNQIQCQQITLKNNLSAPVELLLKPSNPERIEIEPKSKKLAPFESFVADVQVKILKQFPAKTQKQKETIFIKSDFFDQKINVTLISSYMTTPRDTSLGSSIRITNNQTIHSKNQSKIDQQNIRDSSREKPFSGQQNFLSKDYSPSRLGQTQVLELEKELDFKNAQIQDLNIQVQQQESEILNTQALLKAEVVKRREIEETYSQGSNNTYKEHLDEVKRLLKEREPNLEKLMDITMKKERDQQERKDAKILEILKVKDRQIEEIQQKAVKQESEYGNLSQAFQDLKRQNLLLEEENLQLIEKIRNNQSQLSQFQNKLQQYESGQEIKKMRDIENQLSQANQTISQLENQLEIMDSNISEKDQTQSILQEALDRMREQIIMKDSQLGKLEYQVQDEIQRKVVSEEHVKSLMQQINLLNQENLNERSNQNNQFKSDKDHLDRIDKLQNEKYDLMHELDSYRQELNMNIDKQKQVFERLSQIRGFGGTFGAEKDKKLQNLWQSIDKKIEDIARVLKEMETDNIDINSKLKKVNDKNQDLEQQLENLMIENEEINKNIKTKKKSNGVQTKIDLNEFDSVYNNFERVKQRCIDLENQNERMEQELNFNQHQLKSTEAELDKANQELNIIVKSHNQQNKKYSLSTQSDFTQNQQNIISNTTQAQDINEDIISRLNAKITQLKINEDKLIDQINSLRQQQQENNQLSTPKYFTESDQIVNTDQKRALIGAEEKMGEYEMIIIEQREMLIKCEEENCALKLSLKELSFEKEKDIEVLQQKIKSLNEMNRKYEQIQLTQKITKDTLTGSLLQSEGGYSYCQSNKSTNVPAETERMRQYAQQMELNNMNLKHGIDEAKVEKDMVRKECQQFKDQVSFLNKQIISLKQYSKTQGLNCDFTQEDQTKLVMKIQEQKKVIKQLELQIRNAQNQDLKSNLNEFSNQQKNFKDNSYAGQRIDDLVKTNERLRKEHQQQILIVLDQKEEYASKLQYLADNYQSEREKLKNQNLQTQRKLESLQSQIQYMEKKEIRLFGQLEEARMLQQQETEDKERRTNELEQILFKKEETLNDLEREIKQKERSLQERQEQISVLIEALENENSSDQLRQKVLNLSAELCSLKAIEAQQEKRANEMIHQIKKIEMNNGKNFQALEQEKIKNKDFQQEIQCLEKKNQENQKVILDQQIELEEKLRQCNDWKYKSEREEFQLQLKEESILQMRSQIKRSEQVFRDEVEKLRKDFSEKQIQKQPINQINNSKALPFKQALGQLNLLLSDFLQSREYQNTPEQQLIQELEKVINISSQTIETIQQDLDSQKIINCNLQNEYRALSLNKILIQRQEYFVQQLQSLQKLMSKREQERQTYIREKDQGQNKIIREQEMKLEHFDKLYNEVEDNLREFKIKYEVEKEKKEEAESQLVCFQQELNNQRMAFEKKAEIAVDERFKSKFENIKVYFESNIAKILLSQGGIDKAMELGREICSLKLLVGKLEQKLISYQTDKDSLEVNIQYFKELFSQQEQKYREVQVKNIKYMQKNQQQDIKLKLELEKKKQENLQQEKEILKLKDQIEEKERNLMQFEEKISINDQFKNDNSQQDQLQNDEKIQEQSKQIQRLQEKLMEIRSQNIQELEELKLQYDLEVSEAKREIMKDRQQLERRYLPGNAPGDLLEQNDILRQKIDEFRVIMERVTQENVILRKKVEQEKINQESQKGYVQAHKQALADLETTLMEISQTSQFQNQGNNTTQYQQFQKQKPEEEGKRRSSKSSSKPGKNLHFKKEGAHQSSQDANDNYRETMQQSHSKINYADSSLDVSAFTSVNMMPPQRPQNQKQFIVNPPQIVKALVSSKLNEMIYKKRVEELIQVEISLREQLKEDYKKLINQQDSDFQMQEYKNRILEIEIENEDLKIQRAYQNVDIGKALIDQQNSITHNDNQNILQSDYNVLVQSVLALSIQLADPEFNNEQCIEQSQRLVIKALTQNKSNVDLQYKPSNDYDRKVWYLELLESQVDSAENIVKNLQNFIKKLSIDIQGNLQSAAQIKAASMDLAQNTKHTAEEIQTLRYIAGLVKHDLYNMKSNNKVETIQKTLNPFTDNIIHPQVYSEQMYQSIEALQNQLTITEKVKQTLEKDLVSLRIHHAQELQHIQDQYRSASQQRDSLIANNEDLHSKLINMESNMNVMKDEISLIGNERNQNMTVLLEKEREKDQLAKNKNATSKHLQKLQQDLNEWRKQSDENMKTKEKLVSELQAQVTSLSLEKDRLKAENSMLRSNAREKKSSQNEEVQRYEIENQELQDKLEQERESRKKEIEFWVSERTTMREMIDQLENDKVNSDINNDSEKDTYVKSEEQVKKLKKQNYKKLKQKEFEIKGREKETLDLKDQLQKVKLTSTNLEQKVREVTMKYQEAEERLKYQTQKLKEVELERNLVIAEKNNAISTNDLTAQQICEELNSLRECFSRLKVERDNLLYEMDTTRIKEQEWKTNVESLNGEMQTMEKHLIGREKEQSSQLKVVEAKCNAMVQDVKYLRTENERLKLRVKEQENQIYDQERNTHSWELRNQELKFQIEEKLRKINELERENLQKCDNVKEVQNQLILNEDNKYQEIQKLGGKINEIKEVNLQVVTLYENQLDILKQRFIKEKGKSEQKVEQMVTLAQREAVIKSLKKDNLTLKGKVSKLSDKNKELKNQVKQNQENQIQNKVTSNKIVLKKKQQTINQSQIEQQKQALSEDEYKQTMEQFQNQNQLISKITELEAEYAKSEQYNTILSQQLSDQQEFNTQLQREIDEINKKELKESKAQKQSQNNSELSKQHKQEIKNLTSELQIVRLEWMSPEEKQLIMDQMKELQSQIKNLKDEISRKRDVINTMKYQRDQTESEANQIIQDLEGLKDDNVKLQKLVKENNKNQQIIKELKGSNEFMKNSEKKFKEEIQSLNEKNKIMKTDIQRKEQIIKDLKDKLDSIQDDFNYSKEKSSEIERLKEQVKKYKLEVEIKESQVKAMKQKIENKEEELDQFKMGNSSLTQNSQFNQQQIDQQLKSSKIKVKKYENYLKKSLETLRKIGKELAQNNEKLLKQKSKKKNKFLENNPLQISDLDRELYKDSVNILGVSIDELEEFITGSVPKNTSSIKSENSALLAKLDKAVSIPESLNQDLDQIQNYCVKLINDMNPSMELL